MTNSHGSNLFQCIEDQSKKIHIVLQDFRQASLQMKIIKIPLNFLQYHKRPNFPNKFTKLLFENNNKLKLFIGNWNKI